MQKVFAKKFKDNTFSFYDDDVYHLTKVLKIKLNEEIIVNFDGQQYLTKVINCNPLLSCVVSLLDNNTNLNVKISLYQAVIKPKHMEWIIAKAAEMQVYEVFPILFNRSNKSNLISINRMELIAKAASSQCGANFILNIHDNMDFDFQKISNYHYDLIIVCYEKENFNSTLESLNNEILLSKRIAIIVGPEGGFTSQEIQDLEKIQNVKFIRLTKTILRSETASFYIIANLVNKILNGGNG